MKVVFFSFSLCWDVAFYIITLICSNACIKSYACKLYNPRWWSFTENIGNNEILWGGQTISDKFVDAFFLSFPFFSSFCVYACIYVCVCYCCFSAYWFADFTERTDSIRSIPFNGAHTSQFFFSDEIRTNINGWKQTIECDPYGFLYLSSKRDDFFLFLFFVFSSNECVWVHFFWSTAESYFLILT